MKKTPLLPSSIEKGIGKPLYVQICDVLRRQIISRHLCPGSRLPSSRNYAIELGVSRTSVVAAFEQLQAEGYIESRHGSGCYVMPMGSLDVLEQVRADQNNTKGTIQWGTASLDNQSGSADMRLFPYRQWARCVSKVARESPESLVQLTDPFGDRHLRESIAKYLFEWRGMQVSPKQILVTAGSVDALEICIRTLLKENELIGLEDPGYPPLRNLIKNMGLSPVWLPVNQDSVQVPPSTPKKTPRLVVLTPSHQFPLGGAIPPGRRIEFLNWAEKAGSWIIEDDYDSEFRYAGKPIPALTGFDQSGRSIYIGSFAKIFSTGLRLGFLVAPFSLLEDINQTLSMFASKASVSMQRPLSEFMNNGEFYRHIRRVRRIYGERRKTLMESIRTELGDILSFDDHQAGMLFTAKLPDEYDDIAIVKAARAEGILVSALSTYYVRRNRRSGLLINFCTYENEEIVDNILKLKHILKRFSP